MMYINGIDYIKEICDLQANLIPGGVIYVIIEGDTITWRKASDKFDADIFHVGDKLNPDSVTDKAIKEKKTYIENVPRSLYGMRLKVVAEPILNAEGQAVGAFSTAFPVLHPLIKAFNDFAPILSEMFSDGVVMYTTDLNKCIDIQQSKEFQLSQLKVGDNFKETTVTAEVIKTKKSTSREIDASEYGVPVLSVCYPLFNEDTNEIVGTFGMLIPKATAANLKKLSQHLENGLTEIASTIEELAASSTNIHSNEQTLNKSINEITDLSEEINAITSFIKEIADETKMLGLNAAIEAARAGEAGKGFGVVADEIRKLSAQSKSTVPKIQKLTDEINVKVNESSEKSQSSLSSTQEQAAATEEITASIEEIISLAEELNTIALKL